uniref:Uncharacterized protein n=1 Tax=Molossus molossus TaxID=27622 RepID=A0A7J8ERC6_MOLMO|nr:hypothetical protein HJG59_008758 [Molossus molossus]
MLWDEPVTRAASCRYRTPGLPDRADWESGGPGPAAEAGGVGGAGRRRRVAAPAPWQQTWLLGSVCNKGPEPRARRITGVRETPRSALRRKRRSDLDRGAAGGPFPVDPTPAGAPRAACSLSPAGCGAALRLLAPGLLASRASS